MVRSNLDAQLAWLSSCRTWDEVFGTRFDKELLQQKVAHPSTLPQLLVARDWDPLWQRAREGKLNGGEVREERRRHHGGGGGTQAGAPVKSRAGPVLDIEDFGGLADGAASAQALQGSVGQPRTTRKARGQGRGQGRSRQPSQDTSNLHGASTAGRQHPPMQTHPGPGAGIESDPQNGWLRRLRTVEALPPEMSHGAANQPNGFHMAHHPAVGGSAGPTHGHAPIPVAGVTGALGVVQRSGNAGHAANGQFPPSHGSGTYPTSAGVGDVAVQLPQQACGPQSHATHVLPSQNAQAPVSATVTTPSGPSVTPIGSQGALCAATPLQRLDSFAYQASPGLQEELRQWRKKAAQFANKQAFNIFPNATLESIVAAVPVTEAELLAVPGIGEKKAAEFGAAVLEICRRYKAGQHLSHEILALAAPQGLTQTAVSETAPPPKRQRKERNGGVLDIGPATEVVQVIDEAQLTQEQRACAQRAMRGDNLFISGAAGTGKSFLLRYLVQELEKRYPNAVAITAPTGLAAVNVGGVTIHSWSGVGLGQDPEHISAMRIKRSPAALSRWCDTRVLVIDEVSMLEPQLFEMLGRIGSTVRGNRAQSFGGMQLLLCGDFLQLPPIIEAPPGQTGTSPPWSFCFETPTWRKCGLEKGTVILHQSVRQAGDPQFVKLLNEVRAGRCGAEVVHMLSACCCPVAGRPGKPLPTDGILPTRLYCTNRNVDTENEARLSELPGAVRVFRAVDSWHKKDGTGADKKRLQELLNKKVPFEIKLKAGAQVVLLRRLPAHGLVNGSRGKVEDVTDQSVHVRFDNGKLVQVDRDTYRQVGQGGSEWRRSQIPLKLGWALTMHRAQGMTLTRAEVQLEDCFSVGQAYVALSRLTGFAGLWIKGRISPDRIRAHPSALNFYGLAGR